MSSLRVLHVCPRPKFSGLESWVNEMIRYQAARGTACALIAEAGSPLALKAAEAASPAGALSSTLRIYESDPLCGAAGVRRAAKAAAREGRIDVVHMHGSQDFNALVPWLFQERLAGRRRPTILQLHIWLSHRKRDPWHALVYQLLDELWCSSEPARASVLRALPIPASKTRILKYGRACAAIEAEILAREVARRELGLPLDATVVGTVSRIDRGKGTAELVRGAAQIMKREPKLHLTAIGGPTETPEEMAFAEGLQAEIASMPASLRDRVHFPGPLARSHRLLKAFDVFALPTYRECFSLALMEAQLAGLPCIATDAGGSPELVREGATGWLCAPASADAFAQALGRALADREQWAAFGHAARARVREEYDLEPALAATLDGYTALAVRAGAGWP